MFALRYNPKKVIKRNQQYVGKFASVTARSTGDAEFCGGELAYALVFYGENVWVVTDRTVADAVAETDTPWYNADYTSPGNDWAGDWDVVELEVK